MREPSRIQAFIAAAAFGVVLYAGVTAYTESKFPDAPPTTVKLVPSACWVEDKADGAHERLCGPVLLAPYGAHSFSDAVPEEDSPAFDCFADGNKICGEIPKGLDF